MEKKVCPDCGREYPLEAENCEDCDSKLEVKEVLDADDYLIAFHDPLRENVDYVASDLADHGIEGKVHYVNLGDFSISIRGTSTWALLVPKEHAEEAVDTLHRLYGFTHEAEEEEEEFVYGEFEFLHAPTEELAADESMWPNIIKAIQSEELPEPLAVKAVTALTQTGEQAEDLVTDALAEELQGDHYALRITAVNLLLEAARGIGTEKIWSMLLGLLKDEDSTRRINGAYALGVIGTTDHARYLLPLLEDEDDDVRQEANGALESITGEEAYPEHIFTIADGREARRAWEDALKA